MYISVQAYFYPSIVRRIVFFALQKALYRIDGGRCFVLLKKHICAVYSDVAYTIVVSRPLMS
jgi:hypothetical protein